MRFAALQEYSIDHITQAGTWLLMNRENVYPPVPTTKEFIDAINTQSGQVEISSDNRAEIQAGVVLKKLKYEGRNAPVDFEDPITFHLMTGQWRYNSWAATVKEKDLTWWKKEFVKAYCAEAEGDRVAALALPITQDVKQIENLSKGILKVVK